MEDTVSVRRWRVAERLERTAQHPNVPTETRARALKAAEALKKAVIWSETKKLTKILMKHRRRESR